jgi:hypothetical protein
MEFLKVHSTRIYDADDRIMGFIQSIRLTAGIDQPLWKVEYVQRNGLRKAGSDIIDNYYEARVRQLEFSEGVLVIKLGAVIPIGSEMVATGDKNADK